MRKKLVMAITQNIITELTPEEQNLLKVLLDEHATNQLTFQFKYATDLLESKKMFDIHVSPANQAVCPCCRR